MPAETQTGAIIITPTNLEDAKPGYVVIKNEKGQLTLADPSFIVDGLEEEIKQVAESVNRFDAFTRHVKHFKKLCKSHFINVFALYKTKVMEGEIEVRDEALLYADDEVLEGKKTVLQALKENPALNGLFIKIYGKYTEADVDDGEGVSFPEV